MKIIIETIPHSSQRYPTVGDWWFQEEPVYIETTPPGNREMVGKQLELHIRVSDMGDWKKEALIAIHELAEVCMCKSSGISQEDVDDFDMDYEEHRQEEDVTEPGDLPDAPYHRQHVVATAIERIVAGEMNVDWNQYNDTINGL